MGQNSAKVTVTAVTLQGNQVSSTQLGSLEDGYVLTWDNTARQWKAEPTSSGGSANNLQGNPVVSQTLGAGDDGYSLVWDGTDGYWKAEPVPFYFNFKNTGPQQQTIVFEKTYSLMEITIDADPYGFSGSIIFPKGKPFSAIITCQSPLSVLVADKVGHGASIVAPMDGYNNQLGFISITGIDSSDGVYSYPDNPNGINYVVIGNSTGVGGLIGGYPDFSIISNNNFYGTDFGGSQAGSAPSNTYVDIYSNSQQILNNEIRYLFNSITSSYEVNNIFNNGSNIITGIGSAYLSETYPGLRIRYYIDPASENGTIASVDSDTQITLTAPYTGTSSAQRSLFEIINYFSPNSSEVTFTNGSPTVTISPAPPSGSGFTNGDILVGDFICSNLGGQITDYAQVASIDSDTQITLATPYTGVTGTQELFKANDQITFTNGSTIVTGITTTDSSFISNLIAGYFVKLASDPDSCYTRIASVNSSTQLTLATPYPGNGTGRMAIFYGSTYVYISDGYNTYPDPNNGNLTWATLNGYYQGQVVGSQCPVNTVVWDGTTLNTSNIQPMQILSNTYNTGNSFINVPANFTYASAIVTGSGFFGAYSPYVQPGNYMRAEVDPVQFTCEIYSVDSDTQITLRTPYYGDSPQDGNSVVYGSNTDLNGNPYSFLSFITIQNDSNTPPEKQFLFQINSNNIGAAVFFNQTTQYCTIQTGAGKTAQIAPGQSLTTFSNGTDISYAGNAILSPVYISTSLTLLNTYNIQEPSGTMYIFNQGPSYGAFYINLPYAPAEGTTFTFSDPLGQLSVAFTSLVINAGLIPMTSGGGQELIVLDGASTGQSYVMNGAYSSITLRYSGSGPYVGWYIVDQYRSPSMSPIIFASSFTTFTQSSTDIDYYPIANNTNSMQFYLHPSPFDGQTVTIKDASGTWGTFNFSLYSQNSISLENPVRVTGSSNPGPGTYESSAFPVTFAASGNCVTYKYNMQVGAWLLINQLLPEA